MKLYIYTMILLIIGIIIKLLNEKPKVNTNLNNKKYITKKNPMTETEKKFINTLKEYTNKYNLIILPQVQLQSIFIPINKKDISSFNKIKSKSIDFAIVDKMYNYKLFIELDDYTHNRKKG